MRFDCSIMQASLQLSTKAKHQSIVCMWATEPSPQEGTLIYFCWMRVVSSCWRSRSCNWRGNYRASEIFGIAGRESLLLFSLFSFLLRKYGRLLCSRVSISNLLGGLHSLFIVLLHSVLVQHRLFGRGRQSCFGRANPWTDTGLSFRW